MSKSIDAALLQQDFITYCQINTRSDAASTTYPSTPGQTVLAKQLVTQLTDLGLADVALHDDGFVHATLPANGSDAEAIGFIAHLDTADYAAENVKPQLHPNYDGSPIIFDNGLKLTVDEFPKLKQYFGETLITSDGTTLLGVDDKAGIAAAVASARYLLAHPEIKHGEIRFGFGPDEEIGRGGKHLDTKIFNTKFAYTLDNGALGQMEFETFNGAEAKIEITGTSVHPGEAKNLMVNALTLAEKLDASLPQFERPEFTADHEGFFALLHLSGSVDHASLYYIIRDHNHDLFEGRKATLQKAVAELNATLDRPRIQLTLNDQYYNINDVLKKDPTPYDLATKAIKAVGLTPEAVPFRGGTDGTFITYNGIPTPNLFNGGINFHGPYECVSTEAMVKVAETIVKVIELAAE